MRHQRSPLRLSAGSCRPAAAGALYCGASRLVGAGAAATGTLWEGCSHDMLLPPSGGNSKPAVGEGHYSPQRAPPSGEGVPSDKY